MARKGIVTSKSPVKRVSRGVSRRTSPERRNQQALRRSSSYGKGRRLASLKARSAKK